MKETKEIMLVLVGIAVMLFLIVGLNGWTNDRAQMKCEAKGGRYYQSIDAAKSLCELPKS